MTYFLNGVAGYAKTRGAFVLDLTTDPQTLAYCVELRLRTLGDVKRYLDKAFKGARLKYAISDDAKANHLREAFEDFLRE